MQKTILLTGSTDGIGLEAAKMLIEQGHHVLVHGRTQSKLDRLEQLFGSIPGHGRFDSYRADLSNFSDVEALSRVILDKYNSLDVLVNNAGILNTPNPLTPDGLDIRFVVNTIAPYLLTQRLLPIIGPTGRVINISSAAQSPVNLNALKGQVSLADWGAYAQSKLAITMWSRHMALALKDNGPVIVSVNPGSMLGTKMVKQAFGIDGGDVRIGAHILCQAALADEFATASGKYFDNDSGQFAPPHPDALNPQNTEKVVQTIEAILENITA